jgi:hypothetical protein
VKAFLRDLSFQKIPSYGTNFTLGRLRLWPTSQIVASIAFRIGQHAQKPRTSFPDDPAILVEAPHGISASLVFSQDLRHQQTPGQLGVTRLYVLVSDIGPEPQGLVHSKFHR